MPFLATYTATGAPLEDFPWTYEAGQVSPPFGVTIENTGPGPASPVLLALQTESPTQPGTWLRYGTPPQDEQWIRAAVVGFDASGAIGGAAWSVPTTEPIGIGSGGGVTVAEWPEGGKVFLELSAKPPGSTFGTGQYRHRLEILYNENSVGAPFGLETGVTSGIGVGGYGALVEGFELTHGVDIPGASDTMVSAAGLAVLDGRARYAPEATVILDQFDGDDPVPAQLAGGEAYRALLYVLDQGDGTALVEVVKGLKDGTGTPVAPNMPPGAVLVADHLVQYEAGGTSIIDPADTLRGPWYDRFYAEPDPADGLALIIGPGSDIGPGVRRFRGTPTSIAFDPNITEPTAVWLGAAGDLIASLTRPDTSARLLWDDITTDATDVLTWRDRRQFPKGELGCQSIRAGLDGPLNGTELAMFSTPQDLHVLRVVAHLTRTGTPATGDTIIDILIDADPVLGYDPLKSIWPTGTPLTWPAAATELEISTLVELPEIPTGARVGVWQVDLATGGQPSTITVCLLGHHTG